MVDPVFTITTLGIWNRILRSHRAASNIQIVSAAVAAPCQNHPAREAIGVCVECRARICSECVTKVDGINHCVACYAKVADRGAARRAPKRTPTGRVVEAVGAASWLAVLALLTWALLEATLPGGG